MNPPDETDFDWVTLKVRLPAELVAAIDRYARQCKSQNGGRANRTLAVVALFELALRNHDSKR